MSVHKAITKHLQKQHETITAFLALDEEREEAIEKVIAQAKANEAFSTAEINQITEKINNLAKSGVTPTRKYVTPEMVLEYINKIKK